jgi:hypothetical protein
VFVCKTIIEIFAVLGCYRNVLVTDLSEQPVVPVLKGQESRAALSLKMGSIVCAEASVTKYQPALRNVPEERRHHLHCLESEITNQAIIYERNYSTRSNDIVLSENKVLFNMQMKYDLPTFSRDSHPPASSATNIHLTMFIFVNVFGSDH